MDMFSEELEQAQAMPVKTFYDYAVAGDKAGALRHLRQLDGWQANVEVLKAGFSSIYGRGTDKSEFIAYSVSQIGVKTPRLINC